MSDKPMFTRTIFDGDLMLRAANEDGSVSVCAFSSRRTMLTFDGDGYSFRKYVLRTSARFITLVLISAAVMVTIGGLSGLWLAGGV